MADQSTPTIQQLAGNVGIGTSSPSFKLDVNGTVRIANTLRIDGYDTSGAQRAIGFGGNTLNTNPTIYSNGSYLVITTATGQPLYLNGDSNGPVLMNGSGNVGIGTTSPTVRLHIENGNSTYTSPSSNNVPSIYIHNTNGSSTSAHAILALRTYTGGGGNPFISFDINGVRGYAMGIDNADDDKFKINYGWSSLTSDTKITLQYNGNLGVGTTAPAYLLDVSGTIRATGDVIAYSDARVKENVSTIEKAIEKIKALRGVSYTRTDSEDKSEKIGVIAQEVLEVLPQVVQQDENGNYSVAYGNMVGILIEAVKELTARIEQLENK